MCILSCFKQMFFFLPALSMLVFVHVYVVCFYIALFRTSGLQCPRVRWWSAFTTSVSWHWMSCCSAPVASRATARKWSGLGERPSSYLCVWEGDKQRSENSAGWNRPQALMLLQIHFIACVIPRCVIVVAALAVYSSSVISLCRTHDQYIQSVYNLSRLIHERVQ